MMHRLPRLTAWLILAVAVVCPCTAQPLTGTWHGYLHVGAAPLSIVMHLGTDAEGKPTATFDSPDQQKEGITGVVKHLSADSVNVQLPDVAAIYAAHLRNDSLEGVFVQRLQPFSLTMERGPLVRRRPQTPQPPLPYLTEDVTFSNDADSAVLAGTLTLPDARSCPTAVLMVTGSGLQNRDEEIYGHRPFAVIADQLARHGIASLRYDDRGFGLSTGNAAQATTQHLMNDAAQGLDFLRKRGFKRVGLLGHSEGAMIAFMLAARGKTDFIVAMAAPALRGDSIIATQIDIERPQPISSPTTAAQARRLVRAQGSMPWLDFFLDYDPAGDIAATLCPTMAVNGERDTQVDCNANLGTIRRLLPRGKRNLVKAYDRLNHLFQHCQTGLVGEYGQIEETISEEVLADIVAWIHKLK